MGSKYIITPLLVRNRSLFGVIESWLIWWNYTILKMRIQAEEIFSIAF
jgi:hypothetical protein